MNCVAFSPDHLAALTRLINSQLAAIPPGWILTEAQVAATIAQASKLWFTHYPEQDTNFVTETLCLIDQGRLVAAAQWGYSVPLQPDVSDNTSVLFWVAAAPESEYGLQLLLETIIQHSHEVSRYKITTSRFSFGVGWLGIPATWTHVIAALQKVGFVVSYRWLILVGGTKMPTVNPPGLLVSIQPSWRIDSNAGEWELQLHTQGKLVSECQAWAVPPHFSACAGYRDWITLEWLGVEPEYQRRGIGRWLMVEQCQAQAQRNISYAIMWTGTDNAPLRRLADSLNFRSGPACWEFEMIENGTALI